MDHHHPVPIPEIFFNSDTGRPFESCLTCHKQLLGGNVHYLIEKVIRQYPDHQVSPQIVMEYAICLSCAAAINDALSGPSKKRIRAYFAEHAQLADRGLPSAPVSNDISAWIEKCLIKGTAVSQTGEYQLIAQCAGSALILGDMPFALSLEALNEISSLLSPESLDEMDDFIGDYFTGPPEIAAMLRKHALVFRG